MTPRIIVLHTTEGRAWPTYQGGAVAPHLTGCADVAGQRIEWRQHFPLDVSARALENDRGGVETNTQGAIQVELVGTCDPRTAAKWEAAGYPHVYWPNAPKWALASLAATLRAVAGAYGVPLVSPVIWAPYPASYGDGAPQRLSGPAWVKFRGVCGHQHVPENAHGDPGALPMVRILAIATGSATSTPTVQPYTHLEDDMTPAEIQRAMTNALAEWAGKPTISDDDDHGASDRISRDVALYRAYSQARQANLTAAALAERVTALEARLGATP